MTKSSKCKVEYITHMGDDNLVVDAARVSFDKQSDNYTPEQNGRLIGYLARNNHWTPFSQPQITMRETVPIFVARQRFKHMVGFTYNEVSRRYVDDTPEFFTPDVWRARPEGSVKQGSGKLVVKSMVCFDDNRVSSPDIEYQNFLDSASALYQDMILAGVAPEQARVVLPQSMFTSYYVTGSLAAWARAYKQRIDSHSQYEIQQLAKQWGEIITPLFPVSWENLANG